MYDEQDRYLENRLMALENPETGGTQRHNYASREAWHKARERHGRFCHYCESRSRQSVLCKTCQEALLRLWEAGEDLGLCTCEVVVEWALRQFYGCERPSAPMQQQPDHSGNIQGRVSFTEIPISLFAKIVESIDNDEAVGRMKDNGFKRLLQEIEPDATFD